MELWSLMDSQNFENIFGHLWLQIARTPMASVHAYNRSEIVQNLQTPPVIGNSYFCDTGVRRAPADHQFYADNPLWDGQGCGPHNSCCEFNTPPLSICLQQPMKILKCVL